MRRCLAVLALLVTTWSNAAVFPCGSWARAGGDDHSGGAHEHAGHPAGRPAPAEQDQGDVPGAGHVAPGCGILMACGALSRGPAATISPAIVPPLLDDAPSYAVLQPSTADLTQDPPPPRRLA